MLGLINSQLNIGFYLFQFMNTREKQKQQRLNTIYVMLQGDRIFDNI